MKLALPFQFFTYVTTQKEKAGENDAKPIFVLARHYRFCASTLHPSLYENNEHLGILTPMTGR